MAKMTIEERMDAMEEKHTADQAIIAQQAKIIKTLSAPKGIQSVRPNKKPETIPFTTEQKAEQELRRYIKNAGAMVKNKFNKSVEIKPGFRKGLSEEHKERARFLLKEVLHRTYKDKGGKERLEMKWDETILDLKNHQPPVEVMAE